VGVKECDGFSDDNLERFDETKGLLSLSL